MRRAAIEPAGSSVEHDDPLVRGDEFALPENPERGQGSATLGGEINSLLRRAKSRSLLEVSITDGNGGAPALPQGTQDQSIPERTGYPESTG